MGNGMKSGSGEDPFADVEDRDDSSDMDESVADHDQQPIDTASDETSSGTTDQSGYPWLFTRTNAKDSREMVQFFLQDETQTLESQAQTELEVMLGEEPLLLDIREAAYQVALNKHLDDVAAQLQAWGYDPE